MKKVIDTGFGFATPELIESYKMPVQISPVENPSIPDRVFRMAVGAMVNSGTDRKEAFKAVLAKWLGVVAMVLLFWPGVSQARVSASVEYFTLGGANTPFQDDAKQRTRNLSPIYTSASVANNFTSGLGARISLLQPAYMVPDSEWGISIGHIQGPSASQTIDFNPAPGLGAGQTKIESDLNYTRLMVELVHRVSESRTNPTRLMAAFGFAGGTLTQKIRQSGTKVTLVGGEDLPYEKRDDNFMGFSFDLGISQGVHLGRMPLELGLRFSHFPSGTGTDNAVVSEWEPVSFWVAASFL